VVAKVEFNFGELFPRVGFIVTNLETDSRAVVRFYNKRGTAEQWIRETDPADPAERNAWLKTAHSPATAILTLRPKVSTGVSGIGTAAVRHRR